MKCAWCQVALLTCLVSAAVAFPEQGKFSLVLNSSQEFASVAKTLYNETNLFVRITCFSSSSMSSVPEVAIGWILRETHCWNEYAFMVPDVSLMNSYYANPGSQMAFSAAQLTNLTAANFVKANETLFPCNGVITLGAINPRKASSSSSSSSSVTKSPEVAGKNEAPLYTVDHDGNFLFVIHVHGHQDVQFEVTVDVRLQGSHGYLSIVDYPLLLFYGIMCGLYVLMGLAWLVVSAKHWRDLLRIQFWISGVIFLGMLEKALFYSEFQNINSTGFSTKELILAAEIVSCAKRTLARMLVIIVSLGFGIVKPRLGSTLHRVVGIGGLYFVLASAEAWIRVFKPKNDISSTLLLSEVPLAVIDSSICWWVFSALVQTTRALRLRRNLVKLSLYRNFANTLIFSVAASIIFMLWSIKYHRLEECLVDWRDLWIDEAFWHLLFSLILIVIMILWRPSQNNQRYAFTPLLDSEDEDHDEEEPGFNSEAFDGIKLRLGKTPKSVSSAAATGDTDEDLLKWVEEHIPESMDNPLPVLDSDEELENTKFEISKIR